MADPSPPPSTKRSHGTLARGAYTNLLGMGGKLLLPAAFVVIARLYGPDTMGVFLLAFALLDMVANLTVSGISDGVLLFATRNDEDRSATQDDVYQILANGFVIGLSIAAALILLSRFGGPLLLNRFYESDFDVIGLVQVMALSLPFRVLSTVVVAATKVQMTMKWEALLNGFARPALLLLTVTAAYFVSPDLTGLAWAYMVAWGVVGLASLFVFRLHYSYRPLFRELGRLRLSMPLLRFAIPQNLNMAFSRFATDLDLIMLAFFQVSEEVLGFYGMAAQIVRNLRQVKLIFSGAYAPMIVRLHTQGDQEQMNLSYSMVSRWATTIALPGALAIVFFRSQLIRIFDDSFTGDTTFMLLLLVPPLLSCGVGLASNIVVMTGHSKWNLFNSFLSAGLNGALNYALIPRFGLVGAAIATAVSSLVVTAVTATEARLLVGASLMLARVYKPLVAGLAAATIPIGAFVLGLEGGIGHQTIGFGLALAVYFGVLRALGIADEDVAALMPWRKRAAQETA